MSHEEVGRLVRRAADHAAAYLDSVDDRPVFARATFTQMVDAFGGAVPEEPTDAESVLERLARTAEPGLTAVGSGRFFGFVMGGSVPAAQAADVLVGAAGNVNTGAFDPIGAAVDLAHSAGGWVHVDGAFGLWAAASPQLRHLVEGVERADSWATDAHKWLNVPYDCGIAITAHIDDHRVAMHAHAAYVPTGAGAVPDPSETAPEFSRRARGVPSYAAIASLGRRGVADLVERCCAHARAFAEAFGAADGVEVLNDVVLNQVLVRFADSDDVTRAVASGIPGEGTAFMSGTTFKGRAALRISVCNWRTTTEDVARSVEAVLRLFQESAHREH